MHRTIAPWPSPSLRILVVERGAPSRGGDGWTDRDESTLVMQMQRESAGAFEQRVRERLSLAERDGANFVSATLLTSSDVNADQAATRERLALSLARHCAAHGAGELILEGALEHELGVGAPLLALAESVRSALTDRLVSVQVNLREPTPPRAAADSAFWRVDTRRFRAS